MIRLDIILFYFLYLCKKLKLKKLEKIEKTAANSLDDKRFRKQYKSKLSRNFHLFYLKKKPPVFILINEREKIKINLGFWSPFVPNFIEIKRFWFHFPSRERAVTRHLKFIVASSLIRRKLDVVLITFLFQRK